LPVVAAAQGIGVEPFDLVICDEAHRTTGVTVAGTDESHSSASTTPTTCTRRGGST